MDDQGMLPHELKNLLVKWDEVARGAKRYAIHWDPLCMYCSLTASVWSPHVMYTVPVGQNPTGVVRISPCLD